MLLNRIFYGSSICKMAAREVFVFLSNHKRAGTKIRPLERDVYNTPYEMDSIDEQFRDDCPLMRDSSIWSNGFCWGLWSSERIRDTEIWSMYCLCWITRGLAPYSNISYNERQIIGRGVDTKSVNSYLCCRFNLNYYDEHPLNIDKSSHAHEKCSECK